MKHLSLATAHHTPRNFGLTLVEMVVSLSVVSIVFLSMGSVMMLAGKTIPKPDDPIHVVIEASEVMQQLASELQTAASVAAVSDRSIAFTVPDRTDSGGVETLAYFWSGTDGDTLTRIYNGGSSVPVLINLSEFSLTYDSEGGTQPPTGVIHAVSITINPGQGAATRVRTTVSLLNEPGAP